MRWTDNHCHLSADADPGLDDLLADAHDVGVDRFITVGTDVDDSLYAMELATCFPGRVFATAGVHPHEAKHGIEGLAELLDEHPYVAVGECGLDYYYEHSPRGVQQEVFAAQIRMAHERDQTLVIHTRDAWEDTFAILDQEGVPERTVLHCFTGGPDDLQRGVDRGMYVSFSGIVTFKAADDLRAAAKLCPLDRVLVETDSPYLAPVPHRGKTNRPALVPLVGEAVAMAMERPVEEVAQASWDNATTVYRL